MLVVFDSNIWIEEFGLRSPLGALARFFIQQKNARVALPEVVRLEVEQNLRSRLTELISGIQSNYRQLLTALGTLKELVLPNGAAVEARVQEVFATLDVDVCEVPFSLGSARSSFLKTINKVPPSDKRQQFKDGVLWADCVALLEEDDVHLVTSDRDFFQDKKYENGLAQNLREEISFAKHSFTLSPSLTELLRGLRTEVILDEQLLANTFLRTFRESIESTLALNGFQLGGSRRRVFCMRLRTPAASTSSSQCNSKLRRWSAMGGWTVS